MEPLDIESAFGQNMRSSAMLRRYKFCFIAVGLLVALSGINSSHGITIIGNYIGGSQLGESFGGGNIHDIFRAAASIWESIILDDFTVTFDYGWGGDVPGGGHGILEQGGTPNRETHGFIQVNPLKTSPGNYAPLFMDPTPEDNYEFVEYRAKDEDLGGGAINVERSFSDASADFEYGDLLTIFLHEIAHGLGVSTGNTSFRSETTDGYINVTSPLPSSGTAIPLAINIYGVTSHIYLDDKGPLLDSTGLPLSARYLPSVVDILAVAQISGFRQLNLNYAIPDITLRTNPEGLSFMVDGKIYYGSQSFSWPVGTVHAISAIVDPGFNETRHQFVKWSDGKAFSHTVTMPARHAALTVTYEKQYLLSMHAYPEGCGEIIANPPSPDGYYPEGTLVQIYAASIPGYTFSGWGGPGSLNSDHSVTKIKLSTPSTASY